MLGWQDAPNWLPEAQSPTYPNSDETASHLHSLCHPKTAQIPSRRGHGGWGPYRTPNSHRFTAGVHSHDFRLIAGVLDAEAFPLILQQDDLGNTQPASQSHRAVGQIAALRWAPSQALLEAGQCGGRCTRSVQPQLRGPEDSHGLSTAVNIGCYYRHGLLLSLAALTSWEATGHLNFSSSHCIRSTTHELC